MNGQSMDAERGKAHEEVLAYMPLCFSRHADADESIGREGRCRAMSNAMFEVDPDLSMEP